MRATILCGDGSARWYERGMAASKKILRGAALVKKAIEGAGDKIEAPEGVDAPVLKKLKLPNDEKLSPGLKTFLAFDATLLGWSFDDEEPEFEPTSLDDLVEQEFGDVAVPQFGEAIEMLGEDCILMDSEGETSSFLYIGNPDDAGEYPVITLEHGDTAKVSGFLPFDVWIAQRLGALPESLPEEYVTIAQALADLNGDGRRSFESQHRDIAASGGDDEDDDEEEDDDDEEEDDEHADEEDDEVTDADSDVTESEEEEVEEPK